MTTVEANSVFVEVSEDEARLGESFAGIVDKIQSTVGTERDATIELRFPGYSSQDELDRMNGDLYATSWFNSGTRFRNGKQGKPMDVVSGLLRQRGYSVSSSYTSKNTAVVTLEISRRN